MRPWIGRVAQLVRALPSHGRGHKFESCRAHQFPHPVNTDQDAELRGVQLPLGVFVNFTGELRNHSGNLTRHFCRIPFRIEAGQDRLR